MNLLDKYQKKKKKRRDTFLTRYGISTRTDKWIKREYTEINVYLGT